MVNTLVTSYKKHVPQVDCWKSSNSFTVHRVFCSLAKLPKAALQSKAGLAPPPPTWQPMALAGSLSIWRKTLEANKNQWNRKKIHAKNTTTPLINTWFLQKLTLIFSKYIINVYHPSSAHPHGLDGAGPANIAIHLHLHKKMPDVSKICAKDSTITDLFILIQSMFHDPCEQSP